MLRSLLLTSLAATAADPAFAQDLVPRQWMPSPDRIEAPRTAVPLRSLPLDQVNSDFRLTIKFHDALQARAQGGSLVSHAGLDLSRAEATLRAAGVEARPLFKIDEAEAARLQAQAAFRSGHSQPDLLGLLIVDGSSAPLRDLVTLGNELLQDPSIEFVSLDNMRAWEPTDYPPQTPLFSLIPDYQGPDPGIDSAFAGTLGVYGQGVRITDIETDWYLDHEDLVDQPIEPEPGQTPDPGADGPMGIPQLLAAHIQAARFHGTAVVGMLAATENFYGITGMVPQSTIAVHPRLSVEDGRRIEGAMLSALSFSDPGDVVLVEVQVVPTYLPIQQSSASPAETIPTVWLTTRFLVDSGVHVVAAAGNGDNDLDDSVYLPYQQMGDSGAIVVGAGSSTTVHKRALFGGLGSNYGSRVNVQAWGENVTTLGKFANVSQMPLFYPNEDDLQAYTPRFSGTSSASPMVAAACALVQSEIGLRGHSALSPDEMRNLLMDTGIPQGGNTSEHIGPFINVRSALEELCLQPDRYCVGSVTSTGNVAEIDSSGSTSIMANDLHLLASGVPSGALAQFFFGQVPSAVPYGNGTLCIAGVPNRLPFFTTSAGGTADFALDLQAAPATMIAAGTTWRFQMVFLDPGFGAGLGTTDGLLISFCP